MKVFVSSVIEDYGNYRDAARRAIESVHCTPVTSEKFGSLPYPSKDACLAEIEQADLYVLLLGQRYGWECEPGLSVTQKEFRYAKTLGKPILVFVQDVDPESAQKVFRQEVEAFETGFHRERFATPDDLKDGLVSALTSYNSTRHAASAAEFDARLKAASSRDEDSRNWSGAPAALRVVFWPQPSPSISLDGIQRAIQQHFIAASQAGLVQLSDGFKAVTGGDHVGFISGGSTLRWFDDGLFTATVGVATERLRGDYGFASSFVSPTRVRAGALACRVFFPTLVGWVGLRLTGMQMRHFDEPPSNNPMSMTMPMRSHGTVEANAFLVPCNEARYTTWVDETLSRFRRVLNESR